MSTATIDYRFHTRLAGLFVLFLIAPLETLAQESSEDIEEVIVTGTLTRGNQFESRSPMQVVDASEFLITGASQTWDILKNLTVNYGSNSINESGSFAGTSQFNIRGLGMSSTLTLVNGRRVGISTGDDGSGNAFTDINQFPVSMISRVEVLTDGSSATYGSDAVGGVANIITRKGFEGLEISADYRDSQMDSYSINMIAGSSFDKGSFNFYGAFYHQDDRNRTDWDWMDERINGDGDLGFSQFLSATGAPGTYYLADGGAAGYADPDCEAAGGFFRKSLDGNGNEVIDTGTCRMSFGNNNSIGSEDYRVQAFVEFDYQLSDRVTYFNESHYSHNETFRTHGAPGWSGGRILVPGDHPFNFFVEDPSAPGQLAYVDPSVWDNNIHTGVDILAQSRPLDNRYNAGGSRGPLDRQRRVFDYYRTLNGLEIEINDNWMATVSYVYNGANSVLDSLSDFRADKFVDLVAAGEWNLFGTWIADPGLVSPKDGVSTADNSQALIDSVMSTTINSANTDQNVVEAIFTGDLFDVGGRSVASAFGAQWRRLSEFYGPDSLGAAGEDSNSCCSFETNGSQEVWGIFGEAIFPLTDSLDVQVALRHEDYGSGSDSTTDPKVTFSLRPVEWVNLRGSYGTSFQAPTVRQTTDNRSGQTLDDQVRLINNVLTCTGSFEGDQATVINQGGELDPQTSVNYNLGITLTPTQNLNASVDYWNYDYDNLIVQSESGQAILNNDCADDGIPNDPRVVRTGGGRLDSITTSFENAGNVVTDGIDLAIVYDLGLNSLGDVRFDGRGTFVNKFEVTDDGEVFDGVGSRNFSNGFHTIPQWRWNAGATWFIGRHTINATVRYIDSYLNDNANNAKIDSMTTLDFQYSVELGDMLGNGETFLYFGVNNAFDVDPPALRRNDSSGNLIRQEDDPVSWIQRPGYDEYGGHDIRGRIVYAKAVYSF